jgi:hypothetical protein
MARKVPSCLRLTAASAKRRAADDELGKSVRNLAVGFQVGLIRDSSC